MLNINKSDYMTFPNRQNTSSLSIDPYVWNSGVIRVSAPKFIVKRLQATLRWCPHETNLANDSGQALKALRWEIGIRVKVELPVFREIYFAYGASRPRYGIAFSSCSPGPETVLRAQKRILELLVVFLLDSHTA